MANRLVIGGAVSLVLSIVFAVLFSVLGEVYVTQRLETEVHSALRRDTNDKVTDEDFTELDHEIRYVSFYNLTNAYALQNEMPPPKPKFEEVVVKFTRQSQYFDGKILDDGNTYEYKEWSDYIPDDDNDMDQEIVQVNPVYLGALYSLAPDETTAFLALGGTVLSLVMDSLGAVGSSIAFTASTGILHTVVAGFRGAGLSVAEVAANLHDGTEIAARNITEGQDEVQIPKANSLSEFFFQVSSRRPQLQSLFLAYELMAQALSPSSGAPFGLSAAAFSAILGGDSTCTTCSIPSSQCCGIGATVGGQAWSDLATCLATTPPTEQPTCFTSPTATGIVAMLASAGVPVPDTVLAAIGYLQAFSVSRTTLIAVTGAEAALLPAISTQRDLARLQFSTGALTSAAAQSLSVKSLLAAQGVCTPIELYAFLRDANGPFASGNLYQFLRTRILSTLPEPDPALVFEFELSLAQASEFVDAVTNPTSNTGYLRALSRAASTLNAYAVAVASQNASLISERQSAWMQAVFLVASVNSSHAATYGKLLVKLSGSNDTYMQPLCDIPRHIGTAEDTNPLTSGTCAIVGIAYLQYIVEQLGQRFLLGCQLVGSNIDPLGNNNVPGLQADGTGRNNGGLFVRRTVGEMWRGWNDPLFSLVPPSALPPGTPTEYNGLAGKRYMSIDALKAGFSSGEAIENAWTYRRNSGKQDIKDVGRWISFEGSGIINSSEPQYPGYGSKLGVIGDVFSVTGLNYLRQFAPTTEFPTPWKFDPKADFEFCDDQESCTVNLFLDTIFTNLTLRAKGPWTKANKIWSYPFTYEDELGELTVSGVPSSSCANGATSVAYAAAWTSVGISTYTPSTCDYGFRYKWVFDTSIQNRAPTAITLPYFGEADAAVRNAVSILNADGQEAMYERETMGPTIKIEPLTGLAVNGFLYVVNCFYVERRQLNGIIYANIFGATTDNDDTFIWPYASLKYTIEPTDEEADDFESLIYGTYAIGRALDITAIVLGLLFFLVGLVCLFVGLMKPANGKDLRQAKYVVDAKPNPNIAVA